MPGTPGAAARCKFHGGTTSPWGRQSPLILQTGWLGEHLRRLRDLRGPACRAGGWGLLSGVRHTVGAVLAGTAFALLAGAQNFRQAGDRAADLPQRPLAWAGVLGVRGTWPQQAHDHGITSLTGDQPPPRLAEPVRSHPGIQNKIHCVRDVVYAEDHQHAHTGNGAHTLAAVRNLATGLIRPAGHTPVKRTLEHLHQARSTTTCNFEGSSPTSNAAPATPPVSGDLKRSLVEAQSRSAGGSAASSSVSGPNSAGGAATTRSPDGGRPASPPTRAPASAATSAPAARSHTFSPRS